MAADLQGILKLLKNVLLGHLRTEARNFSVKGQTESISGSCTQCLLSRLLKCSQWVKAATSMVWALCLCLNKTLFIDTEIRISHNLTVEKHSFVSPFRNIRPYLPAAQNRQALGLPTATNAAASDWDLGQSLNHLMLMQIQPLISAINVGTQPVNSQMLGWPHLQASPEEQGYGLKKWGPPQ